MDKKGFGVDNKKSKDLQIMGSSNLWIHLVACKRFQNSKARIQWLQVPGKKPHHCVCWRIHENSLLANGDVHGLPATQKLCQSVSMFSISGFYPLSCPKFSGPYVDHLVTKLNMYDPFPRILWEVSLSQKMNHAVGPKPRFHLGSLGAPAAFPPKDWTSHRRWLNRWGPPSRSEPQPVGGHAANGPGRRGFSDGFWEL